MTRRVQSRTRRRQNNTRTRGTWCSHRRRMLIANRARIGWRGRHLGSSRVVTFSEEIDSSTRSLFAFGCFDPSAVDIETDAIVARIVVIASYSTMVASIACTEHLFGFILGVIVVVFGCGVVPIFFRVVFRHGCD